MNNKNIPPIWAVVPAAGIGSRMQADIPKQYMSLQGATVLEHTLNKLLAVDAVKGLCIALQNNDRYWDKISLNTTKQVLIAEGGKQRCDSVLNAMRRLTKVEGFDESRDWIMVHDAVRPCVRTSDIEVLISEACYGDAGGLLALPVRDTMKRQGEGQVAAATVEREGLWHALTPQLFPYRLLFDALSAAVQQGLLITDESSAMEQAGYCPLLVQGSEDNIKITRPGDLRLAELYLHETMT